MNWLQTNLEPVPSYLHAGGTIIRKGNNGKCPGMDRDRRSWAFLNDPKKYFATNRRPQKDTFQKVKPKNTLKNTIHFAKVKHDMIIMEIHDY